MFGKNRKHRDRSEAEFEYSPHKLAYEPEPYSPVQDTSRSQPPGSWVDPPLEPRRGLPMPPPSRPLEVPFNSWNESFEAHRQPPMATRPDNLRSPRNLQPNSAAAHSEASKPQQGQSSMPTKPEIYGAPPAPPSRNPPTPTHTPTHTPSNSIQNNNSPQPKFPNLPPSPPPTENTSRTAKIPPRTTDIPPTTNPPKSPKLIKLTAHKPAPFVPKGTEQQEWDDVLGNWSLRDDKESQFLDVVDAIRDHDLDRQLSLPQLVVCGKQSSGKSSVLEAITRVPFPRGRLANKQASKQNTLVLA